MTEPQTSTEFVGLLQGPDPLFFEWHNVSGPFNIVAWSLDGGSTSVATTTNVPSFFGTRDDWWMVTDYTANHFSGVTNAGSTGCPAIVYWQSGVRTDAGDYLVGRSAGLSAVCLPNGSVITTDAGRWENIYVTPSAAIYVGDTEANSVLRLDGGTVMQFPPNGGFAPFLTGSGERVWATSTCATLADRSLVAVRFEDASVAYFDAGVCSWSIASASPDEAWVGAYYPTGLRRVTSAGVVTAAGDSMTVNDLVVSDEEVIAAGYVGPATATRANLVRYRRQGR